MRNADGRRGCASERQIEPGVGIDKGKAYRIAEGGVAAFYEIWLAVQGRFKQVGRGSKAQRQGLRPYAFDPCERGSCVEAEQLGGVAPVLQLLPFGAFAFGIGPAQG